MRYLLDTHSLLWFVLNDRRLSELALSLMSDAENEIFVSPASYWEIALKVGLKKLELHRSYDEVMKRAIAGNQFEVLHIEPKHAAALIAMPHYHRDPFDRMLVAQAHVEELPIISNDEMLDAYGVNRLW